ncbi:MAG: methyl-accepting chemotaxis protein [Candidatus Fimivivens sp.]|nr:methyl-accepting chemotaxis protein [Candidatus Fimivivens sp.]
MGIKKMKLATKTSIIIGLLLMVMLSFLTIFSVNKTEHAIKSAIQGEFSGIAAQNGLMVEAIIDDASSTTQDLQNYLEGAYQTNATMTDEEKTVTKASRVYAVDLQQVNYDVEDYILNTAWSVLKSNPDIVGVGALFEPNAFDPAVKDYSLYITTEDAKAKKAKSLGTSYSVYSAREYYKVAKDTKQLSISKPYDYEGIKMITVASPIIYHDQVQGVILVDINIENFSKIKTTDEKYPTMYVDIYSQDNTIVYDSESSDFVGVNLDTLLPAADYAEIAAEQAKGQSFIINTKRDNGAKVIRFFYPIPCGSHTWWAASILNQSDLNKDVNSLTIWMLSISAFVLVIIITITSLMIRKMINPIQNVLSAANDIAQGKLDINISSKSEDEIGQLAKTFMNMSANLKYIISDINSLLGSMSDGDFRIESQCQEKYVGDYYNILLAIRGINTNLSNALLQIHQASEQVSSGSDQVSSGAQALSQGATEQASAIQQLSASISEISDNIRKNAENAQSANNLSNETRLEVETGSDHMRKMVEAMDDISNSSNQIGKIIKTIDDIAFQTNILALNAAVEAARAGEAGKGFAVVADEVRNLAGKAAAAAKNTTVLIEGAVSAVENGTRIADETAKSLGIIVSKVTAVSNNINDIATTSERQAEAITQVTLGVEQISAVVQTNSATAEESAAASEELSGQAQILKDLVGDFKLRENSDISVNDLFKEDSLVPNYQVLECAGESSKY